MSQPPKSPGKTKTLLIGWDGADWSFLRPFSEKGSLPVLTHLAKTGVVGELQSLPPYLSPMLWNSIATGKRPWKHGIHGFTEVDADGKVRPISSRTRKVPALWNMLSSQGLKTHVVGWFASHPAEVINGVSVSEAFFQDTSSMPLNKKAPETSGPPSGAVYPKKLGAELAGLLLKPSDLDPKILRLFIPEVTKSMLDHDPIIKRLIVRLAEVYSVHNVMASILETEEWDFAAVYFHFIDWVLHDFAQYMAPKGERISRAAFQRYSGVVEAACRLQDTLMAELLNIAGANTRGFLMSDHGFATGGDIGNAPHVPAGIAAHHRPQGIFAAWGPGIRRGERIQGASLLDITPTILHSLNLPVGADMDGRVLEEVFAPQAKRDTMLIPSWDERIAPVTESEMVPEDPNLMERFIQLGYVDPNVVNNPLAAELQRIDNGWNLGMDMLNAGRPLEALPYLEEAHWSRPEMPHYTFWLARCQAACGLIEEAWKTGAVLDDFDDSMPLLHRFKGLLALESGRPGKAVGFFDRAMKLVKDPGDLPTLRALALGQSGKWLVAIDVLQEEVKRNPTSETWVAIVQCYLWAKRPAGALAAARQLMMLNPHRAQSHLLLARSLEASGEKEASWQALRTAQRLRPGLAGVFVMAESVFPEHEADWKQWARSHAGPAIDPKAVLQKSRDHRKEWEGRRDRRRQGQKPVFETGKPEKPGSSGKTFVVVSGVPRSGTSMLMQMLRAGGLEPMTDEKREANVHNPRGFLEWEPIKRLPSEPELIEQCTGKAVKVVSVLTISLPRRHTYDIVAMTRPAAEILRSQTRMLGMEATDAKAEIEALENHQQEWLKFLRSASSYIRLLELDYGSVIKEPKVAARAISEFLGPERIPHPERMIGAVDSKLYRNRQTESIS